MDLPAFEVAILNVLFKFLLDLLEFQEVLVVRPGIIRRITPVVVVLIPFVHLFAEKTLCVITTGGNVINKLVQVNPSLFP
jgi:hypothetical protein